MESPEGAAGVVFSTCCEAVLLFPVTERQFWASVCEFSTTDSDSRSISSTDTTADLVHFSFVSTYKENLHLI